MAIITLTTDFGSKDHYVGSVKGAILNQSPSAVIIDISHQIEKFNIQDAAFILKEAYPNFPKNTVHIIGLQTEYTASGGFVAIEHNEQFFIGADNGIFSLIFEEQPKTIVEIPVAPKLKSIFPVRDIFASVACKLSIGTSIKNIGNPKQNLEQRLPFRATSMGNTIRGSVVFIDSYGNVITNIDRSLFEQIGKGEQFVIELARNNQIERISNEYNEVPEGELVAIFNSANHLEIAMRNGTINTMLNLKLHDSITISFQ